MPTEYEPLTTINRKHNSNSLKNGNTPPVEYATMRDSAIDVKLTHLKKKPVTSGHYHVQTVYSSISSIFLVGTTWEDDGFTCFTQNEDVPHLHRLVKVC